jgi:hypothetical protein
MSESMNSPSIPATPGESAGTGTLEEAAGRLESVLFGKPPRKQPANSAPQAETAPEDTGADEADLPDETLDDEGEAAQSDASPEGEATDATDEAEEGAESEDQLYTVKIDGKEEKVPLKELLNGYQRTADYHRKTEALANERRGFQGHVQAVQTERAQYAQLLPALTQQLQSQLPPPPDPSLRDSDPLEYMLQKDRHDEVMQRISAAQSEMQRVQQAQAAQQAQELRSVVEAGFRQLPDLVPAWKDPKVYERDRPKLREYLRKSGYSDAEMNQAYDPRAVAAAYKAMKYDELVARRPKPDQPLERAMRPITSPSVQPPKRVANLARAKSRLASSGSIDDAAAAFGLLLRD